MVDLDELERDMARFPAWKFHSYEGENSLGHRASLCSEASGAPGHRCLGEVFAASEDAVKEVARAVERVTGKLLALIAELRAARELIAEQALHMTLLDQPSYLKGFKDGVARTREIFRRPAEFHGAEVTGGKTEGE